MAEFRTSDAYRPTGDQPEAIRQLSADLKANRTYESALAETREETVMRARNLAAIHVLGEELRRRGDDPPENWLPAYRRWKQIHNDAAAGSH